MIEKEKELNEIKDVVDEKDTKIKDLQEMIEQ
jgi:hypothetical protein